MSYISLKQARQIFGYHPDYLSQLIRKGKLKAKRIGRDWFITEKAIKSYLNTKNNKFFPLDKIDKILDLKIIAIFVFIISIISLSGFFVFESVNKQEEAAPEDFSLEAKNTKIETQEIREIRVTNYSLDDVEEREIVAKVQK